MTYSVDAIRQDASDRDELIAFLMRSPGKAQTEEKWRARLRFWWEENPAANAAAPWGWTLRHSGRIAGFLGCVPAMYEFQSQPVPALAMSTWRVLEEHRGQSLRLFLPLFKLSRETPVLCTTPSPAVMQVLERFGFLARRTCTRHFFGVGRVLGPLLAVIAGKGGGFPALAGNLRVVTDASGVAAVARPVMRADRLEKRISPEYLRWLVGTSMERLHFAGSVDETGLLTSYLVLKRETFKGIDAWITVDWFTTRDSMDELAALTGELCRRPQLLPDGAGVRLLAAVSFAGDDGWQSAPAVGRRETSAKHFYSLPEALKGVPKRCVLAEGDFLL